MGFATGPVSFRRLFISGQHADHVTEAWIDKLATKAFGSQRVEASDGVETGWIAATHFFDTDFSEPHRMTFDQFLWVAMRVDRTAPPSSIVKSYRMMEEAAALKESGQPMLSKMDRRIAKEAALRRAESEARKGMYRRMTSQHVVMDMSGGSVWFAGGGGGASDRLCALFADTFDLSLVPATLEEVAFRTAANLRQERAFDQLHPALLVEPPAEADTIAFPGADRGFLGREFLAWLWYKSDTRDGLLELPGGDSITVAIHKMMQLDCSFGMTGRDTIRSDAPASTPEAKAGLAIGKMPTKMSLLMGTNAGDWSFTLDGVTMAISGLMLPDTEEEDPRAVTEQRLHQTASLVATLDRLLSLFMRTRLSEQWQNEHAAMRRWAGPNAGATRQAQRATA